MAKRFFYVCLGLLALAVAYHLGAQTATSQGFGTATGISVSGANTTQCYVYAVADNGDCYRKWQDWAPSEPWQYFGNIFAGGVATQPSTWGQIKAQFKE